VPASDEVSVDDRKFSVSRTTEVVKQTTVLDSENEMSARRDRNVKLGESALTSSSSSSSSSSSVHLGIGIESENPLENPSRTRRVAFPSTRSQRPMCVTVERIDRRSRLSKMTDVIKGNV